MSHTRFALVAAVLLLASDPASAQSAMRGQVHDLALPAYDLEYRVQDLENRSARLEVEETDREIRIALSGDVLFDFDKSDIRPDAEPVLRDVVELLQNHPHAEIRIDGHTDAKGSVAYNLRLSERRAGSVRAWLAEHAGIESRRMTTYGYGKSRPVAPNAHPDGSDNPQGRQQNRRVEITIRK